MRYEQLIEQIKTEARVKADTTFDDVAIALINELFKEATEAQRPFELRADVSLSVVAATGLVTLPDDFFVFHQVLFQDSDTSREYPLTLEDEAIQPAPRGLYGHPKSYSVLADNTIALKPYAAIVTGDHVRLVYYKIPPIIDAAHLGDENSITRLEPFLVRAAIRRIRMLHSDDVQVAQMLSGDVSSAASGYTKDEPVRNPRPNTSRS